MCPVATGSPHQLLEAAACFGAVLTHVLLCCTVQLVSECESCIPCDEDYRSILCIGVSSVTVWTSGVPDSYSRESVTSRPVDIHDQVAQW